jgi:nitroreductase
MERRDEMDLFEAIMERRSCRSFLSEPVDEALVNKVLEAGIRAPSPLNAQPWEFVVITNAAVLEKIHEASEKCKQWAIEKSGWKWLEKYSITFLQSAPVAIAVVGDPQKSGVDIFMEGGGVGYQHACAAAVQNMHLAAHALGLGSLWFTLFERQSLRDILDISAEKVPLALVYLGKAAGDPAPAPRKHIEKKTTYIR